MKPPSLPPDVIQKLFQGQQTPASALFGQPDATATPALAPTAMAAAAPAPTPTPVPAAASPSPSPAPIQAGAISSAMKPPMSEQDFAAANPNASQAFTTPRPVRDIDNSSHPTLNRALRSLFAGLAEYGRPGEGAQLVNRWHDQDVAQQQYDNPDAQAKMKAGALSQAYQKYLTEGGQQAQIEHEQAETQNLHANVPLLQHQQQFLDKVRGLKESGKYGSDEELFNSVLPEAGTIPGLTRQMIVDQINNAKPLGAQFNVQTDKQGRPEFVQDRTGKKFYPDAQGKFADPEMQKQWDSEMQSHQTSIGEEEAKEKRVAGFAAERQGAGFAQQEKMQGVKAVNDRTNTALDADERLSRMERSYQKALKGDQQAMLALLTDHLGMTMGIQKGARITKDILNEAQTSQPWLAKIASKFDDRGFLSGATLGPDQMRQMLDLGYEARDRAYGSAHDAATTYGVPLPKGMETVERKRVTGDKPAIQQGGGTKQPPKGATHIGTSSVDGKKYYLDAQGKKLGPAE